jgi:hypothetical protein
MTKTAKAVTTSRAAKTGPPLPPGTRVQLTDGTKHKGTVLPYTHGGSPARLGLFPVRLDNAICQICDTNDVTVLTASPTQASQ